MLQVVRIYGAPLGRRILVDRLWPRGASKERAGLDFWAKELAPSDALRKAYHADMPWVVFVDQYKAQLAGADLTGLAGGGLVTAAKATPGHAHALAAMAAERGVT
jgi:uncharacterized protein YeaO (DUF488 family)